ncbi:hypothetical protein [Bradyrhizobium sp. CCBAU 53338]|uniref:hypothetical protein n=1 Tax=Bradyrhizobium sp. CCBAU 53338 TaxID=1325111 RepID=UPI00188D13C7|nr:hypothetical protein [Bradyrhizobium sp. CCBAU 53338]QOZ50518.1 hypothetical protein XH90_03460 [Bradyrhizobium sp. CCBAU 53338]
MPEEFHLLLPGLVARTGVVYSYYDEPPIILFLRDLIGFVLSPGTMLIVFVLLVYLLVVSIINASNSAPQTFSTEHYVQDAEAYRARSRELDAETTQIDNYIREMRERAERDELPEVIAHEKRKSQLRDRS